MKKRKKKSAVYFIAATLLVISVIFYFSAFLEVSYFLQAHRKGANIFDNLPRLSRRLSSGASDSLFVSSYVVPACQILHIAVVCAGYESSSRSVTLVKSLLYHRRHALTLHFVVDEIAHRILPTLFETWNLPAVKVFFYNSSSLSHRVSWVPNRHYSGEFGLMKLVLSEVLPLDLQKILVLDTDLLFVEDVSQLWSFWFQMNSSQAFGLVENLSDWYLANSSAKRKSWPAWDRGFNTGVMLMDLEKLRRTNWSSLWKEIAAENLRKFGATHLADQDIINAVISKHPQMVFKLPCEWNLQMGYQSQQNLCRSRVAHLKIVHWNSPKKVKTNNRYAAFFRRHFQTFSQMDGNLLRTEMLHCFEDSKSSELRSVYEYDDNDDGCAELRHSRNIKYRIQRFIWPYFYEAKSFDVALTTQLSMDRFVLFEALLAHWSGPVSAAVYLSDSELSQLVLYLSEKRAFANRTNIALHAVFKEGVHYPINYLRNVALNATDTPFVFLADVDFLSMPGLFELLRERLSSKPHIRRKAFVVPAFENRGYSLSSFPSNKSELLVMLDTGKLQIFRQDVWIQGHAATDYDKWRTTDVEYSVTWRTDYEPYIVMARNETLPYDQRFVGFGWNKVSHIMALNAAG